MCVFNCSDLLCLEVAASRHIVIPREQTGMLVVSLRGVNFEFWSCLGVFQAKRQYFMPPRSRLGFREETQNYAKRNRSQIFLRFMTKKNYF